MNTQYKYSIIDKTTELEPLFSLGKLYVSDFLLPGENPKYLPAELALAFDPVSKLVQLTEQPCQESMWGSFYWYRSNTNPSMVLALKDLAKSTISKIPASKKREVFLDLGCNDATLLSHLDKEKFVRVGIDPSDYPEAAGNCDVAIKDYFSAEAVKKHGFGNIRYATCAGMFYDLSCPKKFLLDVREILADDGIFVLQLSYTPAMILQTEFGNIVHEHLCYYNLTSLKYLFDKVGFKIQDVEINTVNGGSIRVYLQKQIAPDNFSTLPDRDCRKIRVDSILAWEESAGFNDKQVYLDFYQKILDLKKQTVEFIKGEKSKGKTIFGYGSSTKSQTLYQFFELTPDLITAVSEKQECKFGRKMIGTNIPIISDEAMRRIRPDYLLVGPWFFVENFKIREKEYLAGGGKFILPAPKFMIFP